MSRDPFKNDRKACLLAALEDQHGLCFWCRCVLIVLDDAKSNTGFKSVNHHYATLIAEGAHPETLYIASADHLVPQSMGGWTDRDNIVASCKKCNEDRGDMHNLMRWYVIDATGFEPWRKRVSEQRKLRSRTAKPPTRLTSSLRPKMEAALSNSKVIKLVKKPA